MKKSLYLHIGMGKTGTTALQDFFWTNRRALLRHDVSYPRYGTTAHAHHLLSPYIPPDLHNKWSFKKPADWAPRLQKESANTLLLSSELIAWAEDRDVGEFCDCVSNVFDMKVVIYLRRQDDIIVANYNQLVKAGSQQRELEWVLENELAQFDYTRIIERWARSVGKENVIVRPYEKQQFYGGDIRRDFMHHVFGIDIDEQFDIAEGDPNPRFSHAALLYKLQLNRLMDSPAKSFRFNKVLLKYSTEAESCSKSALEEGSLLAPADRVKILQRSFAVNEEIARDYLHRADGVLFKAPEPEDTGTWIKPQLGDAEAREITDYIRARSSSAYRRLVWAVSRGNSSLWPMQTDALKFFTQCIPSGSLARARRIRSKPHKLPATKNPAPGEEPLLLISVHLPLVAAGGYEALLQMHFGKQLISDYDDRPFNQTGLGRNLDAVRKGVRFARLGARLQSDTCLHGHFLPVKYLFPNRGHRKRFVTWLADPVDRLVAHYEFWKPVVPSENMGGVRGRMHEENWSLETFCFCPELRNVYRKYFWAFPMSRFDFIGISEFYETEQRRFFVEILGGGPDERLPQGEPRIPKARISSELRSRIERYHSGDMAIYRRALSLREQ